MAKPMTATAARILEIIVRYSVEHGGRTPTNREIGKLAEISTTSVVNYHLKQLELLGEIQRDTILSRGIVVVGGSWTPPARLAHLAGREAAAA